MPNRVNVAALVDRHGVSGLARKIGVDRRTVHRWHNADADPSPLAREKLLKVQAEHDGAGSDKSTKPAPDGPKRRTLPVPPLSAATSTGVVPSRRFGG